MAPPMQSSRQRQTLRVQNHDRPLFEKNWGQSGIALPILVERVAICYRYSLGADDFSAIYKRQAENNGGAPFCATDVQNCIAGIGPFKAIQPTWFTTPNPLAGRLKSQAAGYCTRPDGTKC